MAQPAIREEPRADNRATVVPKAGRELIALSPADDVESEEGRAGLTDHIARTVIDAVNAERARQGKPPLKKDGE
jgi:hypothetical protein